MLSGMINGRYGLPTTTTFGVLLMRTLNENKNVWIPKLVCCLLYGLCDRTIASLGKPGNSMREIHQTRGILSIPAWCSQYGGEEDRLRKFQAYVSLGRR